jgi:hypothetical protein
MSRTKTETARTSNGSGSNVSRRVLRALRADYLRSGERLLNQRRAFEKGKNVVLTIENPNPHETGRRFIRVNAREVWKRAT